MKHIISLLVLATLFFTSAGYAASKKKKSDKKWNKICQGLLDVSVKSTLKLEKAVKKDKKISKSDLENKIQNELQVVQLNAWVCATVQKDKAGVVAEEQFLKDYSARVSTSKKL